MHIDTLGLGYRVPAEKLRVYLKGASSGWKRQCGKRIGVFEGNCVM